jgi:hypothetical protein
MLVVSLPINLSPVDIYIYRSFSFISTNFWGSPYVDPTLPRRLFLLPLQKLVYLKIIVINDNSRLELYV